MDDSTRAMRTVKRANNAIVGVVIVALLIIIGILGYTVYDMHVIDTNNDNQFKQYIRQNDADNAEQLRLLNCLISITTANISPEQLAACQAQAKTSYLQPAPRLSVLVDLKQRPSQPPLVTHTNTAKNNNTPTLSLGLVG